MKNNAEKPNSVNDYWTRRKNLIYYRYVEMIVRGVANQAGSIIDIGSSNTSCVEWFDWIPIKHALDKRTPYSSNYVTGIEEDFLNFEPQQKYDLAICLQVLEHVPKAGAFARKLFNIADSVLISVPYKWPEGDCKYHIHDPVDEEKLEKWTDRSPDYSVVVQEPLIVSPKGERLIAYYNNPVKKFALKEARRHISM